MARLSGGLPNSGSLRGSMSNPLGGYGPLVASLTAVGIIGAFILSVFLQGVLNLSDQAVQSLREIALLAVGAVFGSAATVASSNAAIGAANKRLDAIGAPPADSNAATKD